MLKTEDTEFGACLLSACRAMRSRAEAYRLVSHRYSCSYCKGRLEGRKGKGDDGPRSGRHVYEARAASAPARPRSDATIITDFGSRLFY